MSDRGIETSLPKQTLEKLQARKPQAKSWIERFASWCGFEGETRGGENKILQQSEHLNAVLQKVENGEEIFENDFAAVINATWYLRKGIDLLQEVGPPHTRSGQDEISIIEGKPSLLGRVGKIGQRLIPLLVNEKGEGPKVPGFLQPAYQKVVDLLKEGATRQDQATESRLAAGKRLAAGLILSREVEKYGIWGEEFDEEVVENAVKKLGGALDEETKTKAQEVHEQWVALPEDARMTLKILRNFCYAYGIHPDSLLSEEGLKQYNPEKPFEFGDSVKYVEGVAKDGTLVYSDKTQVSVYDLIRNYIDVARYKVGMVHLETLAEHGQLYYQVGTTIRLHSWTATEGIMEIAGAGTNGYFFDINKLSDAELLVKLMVDSVKFGKNEARSRFHALVAYSSLYSRFERQHNIPVKFTERAADDDWAEGDREKIIEALELDRDFALATKKYTTGEYQRAGPPEPGSFNYLKEEAKKEGNKRRLRELNLAEQRALELMRMFFAPKGGWTKKEPAAYQLYNYIFAPGTQDPAKQEINAGVISGFVEALKEGKAVWLEGENPVTKQQEIIFKSAQNAPGFFVLSIDPKDETSTPIVRFVDEEHNVLEVLVRKDGTTGAPIYKAFNELDKEEVDALLAKRTNYRKPGWMMPLEEAAGPMWTQAFNMGDVMGGVLATDWEWEVENLQRRITHLARGEMYDRHNPYHWQEIVKHLYKLRTNLGGKVGEVRWGLEFKEEFKERFGGVDMDLMNPEHLKIIAAKAYGITEAQWEQNWREAHGGRSFEGELDENGNPNQDIQEVLQYLMEPRNWKVAGLDTGLYIDLTEKVWQDRLVDLKFMIWRFEQARKTFSTILPALRGLAPSEITIGGARYENGVYHGLTPAKIDKLLASVYGNLAWWEGHQAGQVLYHAVNEQMDREIREIIRDRRLGHLPLSKLFEEEQFHRDGFLTSDLEKEASKTRYFYRSIEITLAQEEKSEERNLFWKAARIKNPNFIKSTPYRDLETRITNGTLTPDEIKILRQQQNDLARNELTEEERTEALQEHHRIFWRDIVLSTEEIGQQKTPPGKAKEIIAQRRKLELRVAIDRSLVRDLLAQPQLKLGDIYGKLYSEQLGWYAALKLREYDYMMLARNPEYFLSDRVINPANYDIMTPEDPRFGNARTDLLVGLFSTASRTVTNMAYINAFDPRKIPWDIMVGAAGAASQGWAIELEIEHIGVDNVTPLGMQFSSAYHNSTIIDWTELDGEYAFLSDAHKRFAEYYLGIDITKREVVDRQPPEFKEKFKRMIENNLLSFMKATYWIDYAAEQFEGRHSMFEWYMRDVLQGIDPGKGQPPKPSYWADFEPLEVVQEIIGGDGNKKLVSKTIKVTYDMVLTKGKEKADTDPLFANMAIEVSLKQKEREAINAFLKFTQQLLTEQEIPKSEDVPIEVLPQLYYYAALFARIPLESANIMSTLEYKRHLRSILTNMRDNLNVSNVQTFYNRLGTVMFGLFGLKLDTENMKLFLDKEKRFDFAKLQKEVGKGKLSKRINPPGKIFQVMRIAQERNYQYELGSIKDEKYSAGGLSRARKAQLLGQYKTLAKKEDDLLVHWNWHGYKTLRDFVYAMTHNYVLERDLKNPTKYKVKSDISPEGLQIWKMWLGGWLENGYPGGYPELRNELRRFWTDGRAMLERGRHKIIHDRWIPLFGGVWGIIGGAILRKERAGEGLKKVVDWSPTGYFTAPLTGIGYTAATQLISGMGIQQIAAFNFLTLDTVLNGFTKAIGSGDVLGFLVALGSLVPKGLGFGVFYALNGIVGNTIGLALREIQERFLGVETLDYEEMQDHEKG